jgi:hypothetical protein
MNRTFLTCLLLGTLVVISCKKKKDEDPVPRETNPPVYSDYSGLKTGNYWVYDEFIVDTLGNAVPTGNTDSCYVEKDTMLHGRPYYKMLRFTSSPVPYVYFESDSLSYITDSYGNALFSSADFSTIFRPGYYWNSASDTVAFVYSKMDGSPRMLTVPAGTFSTLSMKVTYRMYPLYSYGGPYHYAYSAYAEHVGLVVESLPMSYLVTSVKENRLVRYHLN